VTIGGDAAGTVVVVDVLVVVDVVVDVLVVVDDVVVDRAVVLGDEGRAASDELHAAHASSNPRNALLRPRPRCTPS
jgi:hypothetical protein